MFPEWRQTSLVIFDGTLDMSKLLRQLDFFDLKQSWLEQTVEKTLD